MDYMPIARIILRYGVGLVIGAAQADMLAADADVVKLAGTQTITGAKTFSTAPTVPDGSFTQAKVSGLPAALTAKADSGR